MPSSVRGLVPSHAPLIRLEIQEPWGMAMKTCLSPTDSSEDAQIDLRLGRRVYFITADPDTMDHHSLANTGSKSSRGAGILLNSYAGRGKAAAGWRNAQN